MMTSDKFQYISILNRAEYAIAIDQVGITSDDLPDEPFFVHANPNGESSEQTTLDSTMRNVPAAKSTVKNSAVTNSLPPGPLSSFVNANEFGKSKLACSVFSAYDDSFLQSSSYHGRFDLAEKLQVSAIAKAANILAQSVYLLATDQTQDVDKATTLVSANETFVREAIKCLSSDWRCPLMDEISSPFVKSMNKYMSYTEDSWPSSGASAGTNEDDDDDEPGDDNTNASDNESTSKTSLYSGTFNNFRQPAVKVTGATKGRDGTYALFDKPWHNAEKPGNGSGTYRLRLYPNAYEVFIRSFLASTSGKGAVTQSDRDGLKKCALTSDCQSTEEEIKQDLECTYPGVCVPRRSFFHSAYSPAITVTEDPGIFNVTADESIPVWTEARWNDLSTKVFADPGRTIGWVSIGIGAVVALFSVFASSLFLKAFTKK